jgi:hypothetical protein
MTDIIHISTNRFDDIDLISVIIATDEHHP